MDEQARIRMPRLALRIDATDSAYDDVVLAVQWLSDPLRKIVLDNNEEFVRVVVTNSVRAKWNIVQYSRLADIHKKSELIGGRAHASMMYDSIKEAIYLDAYASLRGNITVMPFTEEYYKELPKERYINISEIEFDKELEYNSISLRKILKEHNDNKVKLGLYSRHLGDTEIQVKRIVEQIVTDRLTSTFLEASDLHADISLMRESMVTKDHFDSHLKGMVTKDHFDAQLKKRLDSHLREISKLVKKHP